MSEYHTVTLCTKMICAIYRRNIHEFSSLKLPGSNGQATEYSSCNVNLWWECLSIVVRWDQDLNILGEDHIAWTIFSRFSWYSPRRFTLPSLFIDHNTSLNLVPVHLQNRWDLDKVDLPDRHSPTLSRTVSKFHLPSMLLILPLPSWIDFHDALR